MNERLNAQLLELVCSATWSRVPDSSLFQSCDWNSLFELAKVQTVSGLVAEAISGLPENCHPPKDVRLKFIAYVQQIQKTNVLHRAIIRKVYGLLAENGVNVVFMKGLTAGNRYPNPFLRQCGDIDFVVAKEDFSKTLRLLEQIGKVDYELKHEHHSMAFVDGVVLEPHYKVHNYQHPKNDKAMQEMFKSVFPHALRFIDIDGTRIPVFPEAFESVFLLSHMVNHVYEEGLGLRQVIDYAVFLRCEYDKIDKELHQEYLERMHMQKAYRIFRRICEKYLEVQSSVDSLQYTPREITFADKLMDDILRVGNFGRGEYVFQRDSLYGDLQNYCWVTRRAWKLRYLCPFEAYMWPLSKLSRYLYKNHCCR